LARGGGIGKSGFIALLDFNELALRMWFWSWLGVPESAGVCPKSALQVASRNGKIALLTAMKNLIKRSATIEAGNGNGYGKSLKSGHFGPSNNS
jgi:hypothetical protein